MEIWRLEHPRDGLIEVEVGYDQEFAERGPWPKEGKEFAPVSGEGSFKERAAGWASNPELRMQIKVDGEVRSRHDSPESGRYSLKKKLTKDLSASENSSMSKRHLRVKSNFFNAIVEIFYHDGKNTVALDPPEGSFGAKRRQEMDESPFTRALYPILSGLGKGG